MNGLLGVGVQAAADSDAAIPSPHLFGGNGYAT